MSGEATLCSAESQLQFVCTSESSRPEEAGRLKSDKPILEEQCEQEARHGGRTHDLLDSGSEANLNLHKNIPETRAQYD